MKGWFLCIRIHRAGRLLLAAALCTAIGLGAAGYRKVQEVTAAAALHQQDRIVYLTFDDGPSCNTRELLEVLRRHQAKATFFLIGPTDTTQEEYPQLVREIQQEGHTIAPHSYCHRYGDIYSSAGNFWEDYRKIRSLLEDLTGQQLPLYRFPGGSANREALPGVIQSAVAQMEQQGIRYVDWNIVSGDDTAVVYPPQTLCRNVLDAMGQVEQPVVLFHDAALCSTTPKAVDLLLTQLKQQGYRCEPLDPNGPLVQF